MSVSVSAPVSKTETDMETETEKMPANRSALSYADHEMDQARLALLRNCAAHP